MANQKFNKKDTGKLLEQWAKEYTVLAPVTKDGVCGMGKWDGKDTAFLDTYRNTTVPPKENVFPMMEELFRFEKTDKGYRTAVKEPVPGKTLIFGIRPCDARALALLDITFNEDYEDTYYTLRRQNTVLVGLGCTKPYDSCFCTSLGSGPEEAKNVDIMLTDIGEEFLVEAVTDNGKELIARTTGLTDAAPDDESKAAAAREAVRQEVTRRVDMKDIDKKLLAVFEDKEFWEKIAEKCVSCGICTFLCPTCYCFDISDEQKKNKGARSRCWDSCQFCVYTRMPMENPREEKWRRVRQKVCHKFEFYPMNYDKVSCTGCGRCIRLCPVNWDITQVLNTLPEKAKVESK